MDIDYLSRIDKYMLTHNGYCLFFTTKELKTLQHSIEVTLTPQSVTDHVTGPRDSLPPATYSISGEVYTKVPGVFGRIGS